MNNNILESKTCKHLKK